MSNAPDIHTIAARRVHGLPDEWQPRIYESIERGLGVMLTGSVPLGFYTRGPRKGAPKFPPRRDMQRVIVTSAEIEQTRWDWERETGWCHRCGGGQTVKSIGISGTTYRNCPECDGTGAAKHIRECQP